MSQGNKKQSGPVGSEQGGQMKPRTKAGLESPRKFAGAIRIRRLKKKELDSMGVGKLFFFLCV